MGIPLPDAGNTPRYPSIKLRNVGDYVDVALANVGVAKRKIFNSDQYKVRPDGTVQTQDVLTVVVIGGTGVVDDEDADRPVIPGEVATVFVAGRDRWDKDGDAGKAKGVAKSWSGAKQDFGTPSVGDVVRWKFEATVPGKGDQDRKIRTYILRSPRPEESELVAQCEAIYRGETATALPDSGPAPAEEEAPF